MNQNEVNIDETFANNITMNVMNDNGDKKLIIVEDCRKRIDSPK